MPRRFTLHEAGSLLPEISRLVGDAVKLRSEFEQAEGALQALAQRIMLMGGMVVDRRPAQEGRSRRDRVAEQLKTVLESIQETGCLVKDLEKGLVDFPTRFRGQEVYLCWKLGEPCISFWHGVNEGFAGRKPIDQDFVDHHQGDPTQ